MTASIAALQPSANVPASPASYGGADASDSDSDFTFHDLLSVVNPLQHIPVVSTLYRAITGDTIKPLERIAGDTLYGGAWGFVSSIANLAFKDMTGKDFGDTALALIEGDDDTSSVATNSAANSTDAVADNDATPITSSDAMAAVSGMGANAISATPVASGPPTPLQPSIAQAPASDTAMQALMNAMSDKGIDPALSQRALSAYQKSLSTPPATLVPTS